MAGRGLQVREGLHQVTLIQTPRDFLEETQRAIQSFGLLQPRDTRNAPSAQAAPRKGV
jgi:hypothetical protein